MPNQQNGGSLPHGQDLGYALHGCVSTLSAGPVTPSDGIGLSNKEVIMRSSRTDGVLLHPARPATFTDLMIAKQAASASGDAGGDIGHLWSTYSTVGAYRWEHVLSKEMGARGFMVGPEVLTLDGGRADSAAGAVAYSLNTTTFDLASLQVQHFDSGTPVYLGPDVSRQAFELWHVAPILESGWVRSESLSLFGLVWVCFVTLSERILMGVVHCIHRPNVAGSSMPSPSPISMRARALSLSLSPTLLFRAYCTLWKYYADVHHPDSDDS